MTLDEIGQGIPPRPWETDRETGFVGYFCEVTGRLTSFGTLFKERCMHTIFGVRHPISKALYDESSILGKPLLRFKLGELAVLRDGVVYTREELLEAEQLTLRDACAPPSVESANVSRL
jgi:hypothetical protein